MRSLLHVCALLAVLGFLLPEGLPGGAPLSGATLAQEAGRRGPEDPEELGLSACAFGGGPAVEASRAGERARPGERIRGGGPPAAPSAKVALGCEPPRTSGEHGPLAPGESPSAQAFLLVNGAADAGGARA